MAEKKGPILQISIVAQYVDVEGKPRPPGVPVKATIRGFARTDVPSPIILETAANFLAQKAAKRMLPGAEWMQVEITTEE